MVDFDKCEHPLKAAEDRIRVKAKALMAWLLLFGVWWNGLETS
tara:strand:- start:56 stop:184 length:129 start_codon:yes stop_codon:yes gene_type:complete